MKPIIVAKYRLVFNSKHFCCLHPRSVITTVQHHHSQNKVFVFREFTLVKAIPKETVKDSLDMHKKIHVGNTTEEKEKDKDFQVAVICQERGNPKVSRWFSK